MIKLESWFTQCVEILCFVLIYFYSIFIFLNNLIITNVLIINVQKKTRETYRRVRWERSHIASRTSNQWKKYIEGFFSTACSRESREYKDIFMKRHNQQFGEIRSYRRYLEKENMQKGASSPKPVNSEYDASMNP